MLHSQIELREYKNNEITRITRIMKLFEIATLCKSEWPDVVHGEKSSFGLGDLTIVMQLKKVCIVL